MKLEIKEFSLIFFISERYALNLIGSVQNNLV